MLDVVTFHGSASILLKTHAICHDLSLKQSNFFVELLYINNFDLMPNIRILA